MNRRLGTGFDYTRQSRDKVELFLDEKMLHAPLRWRRPRRVFVCSMTDLFADFVPDEWIDRIFSVMALAPRHTFQVLTKRAERMRRYLTENRGTAIGELYPQEMIDQAAGSFKACHANLEPPGRWPLPNVWLGVSAEDQKRFDERVPDLVNTPAAVRFLSLEPLLGPIRFLPRRRISSSQDFMPYDWGIHWAIIGGESGPRARPMEIAWVREILQQLGEADVAAFLKQLGRYPVIPDVEPGKRGPAVLRRAREIDLEWPIGTHFGNPTGDERLNGRVALLKHAKGGDPSEWPDDLRVREYPR